MCARRTSRASVVRGGCSPDHGVPIGLEQPEGLVVASLEPEQLDETDAGFVGRDVGLSENRPEKLFREGVLPTLHGQDASFEGRPGCEGGSRRDTSPRRQRRVGVTDGLLGEPEEVIHLPLARPPRRKLDQAGPGRVIAALAELLPGPAQRGPESVGLRRPIPPHGHRGDQDARHRPEPPPSHVPPSPRPILNPYDAWRNPVVTPIAPTPRPVATAVRTTDPERRRRNDSDILDLHEFEDTAKPRE